MKNLCDSCGCPVERDYVYLCDWCAKPQEQRDREVNTFTTIKLIFLLLSLGVLFSLFFELPTLIRWALK